MKYALFLVCTVATLHCAERRNLELRLNKALAGRGFFERQIYIQEALQLYDTLKTHRIMINMLYGGDDPVPFGDVKKQNFVNAIFFNRLDDVKRIIRENNDTDVVSFRYGDGSTPLILASWMSDEAIVQELLRNGADVNAKDDDGHTSLTFAARYGNLGVVQVLIQNRADINVKDKNHRAPLDEASKNGHLAIVQELIKSGANINNQDMHGNTAIKLALANNHQNVAEVLLAEKARAVAFMAKHVKD